MPMAHNEYGVVYTPENSSQKRTPLSHDRLVALGVDFIRVTWVDLINNIRYRVVPRGYFCKLLESSRPGVALGEVCLGLVGLRLAPGFSGTGEELYVLDNERTFRLCPYAPGHASVMGFFQIKTLSPSAGLDPVTPLCPRGLLQRVLDTARDQAGLRMLVGFESEFILLRKDALPEIVPVNDADWSVSSKLPSGSAEAEAMEEIARSLIAAGIELQMYHAEAAPGQYEVVTGPLEPLEAADALVSTRETIYNVASKHGLHATFSPKLYSNSCGSGAHTNISLHEIRESGATTARNQLPTRSDDALAPTLTLAERSFLSGVLAHTPALCALTLPTAASYARVADGAWSGGTYTVWGSDNREAVVRVTGPRVRGRTRFEVRFVDGTACPHVALAGLLAAGINAVNQGRVLATGDCQQPVPLMNMEEKRALGVCDADGELLVGRLPRTIAQARKNLANDLELHETLGAVFVKNYLSVNETLETHLQGNNENDAVAKLIKFY